MREGGRTRVSSATRTPTTQRITNSLPLGQSWRDSSSEAHPPAPPGDNGTVPGSCNCLPSLADGHHGARRVTESVSRTLHGNVPESPPCDAPRCRTTTERPLSRYLPVDARVSSAVSARLGERVRVPVSSSSSAAATRSISDRHLSGLVRRLGSTGVQLFLHLLQTLLGGPDLLPAAG